MTSKVEFLYDTESVSKDFHVGGSSRANDIVARALCPFCEFRSGFRQISKGKSSNSTGEMVALHCDSCESIVSCNISQGIIYPRPHVEGLEGDLPDEIKEYYEEALRCLGANAPNGAATVFRKVIDAVCIYYEVSRIEDHDSFYDMIAKLSDEDIITESLRKSLLGVKDGGRDGAHINDQDPTMEQAHNIKQMVDSVLTATVVADQKVRMFREDHPNEFTSE